MVINTLSDIKMGKKAGFIGFKGVSRTGVSS